MNESPGRRYRMPVVFGPTVGPRQGPDGEAYDYSASPRTVAGVRFLTEAHALERLLPPSCALDGEPIVTVEHSELRELPWLAGRAYSMLGVKFPIRFNSKSETLRGPFLSVLWENRPEPILSGREELGFAKVYCELPPPRIFGGRKHWSATWDGHEFIRLNLEDLTDAPVQTPAQSSDGTLHYRYLPSIAKPGAADLAQMVISPSGNARVTTLRHQRGAGTVDFIRSTWEQLPTMYQIVNTLADLPVVENLGGWLSETRGAGDLSNQRVVSE